MPLKVKVWPADDAGAELSSTGEGCLEFEVDYLSLINDETFGKPPLLTGAEGGPAIAGVGDKVLYINPTNVVAIEAEREN